jgi:hypothetical protein
MGVEKPLVVSFALSRMVDGDRQPGLRNQPGAPGEEDNRWKFIERPPTGDAYIARKVEIGI